MKNHRRKGWFLIEKPAEYFVNLSEGTVLVKDESSDKIIEYTIDEYRLNFGIDVRPFYKIEI